MNNDTFSPPFEPSDDPALDQLLASAGRFAAPAGFEDHVIPAVRLPLPDWALKVRGFRQSLTGTARGRLTLLTMTLGMVTSLTFAATWAIGHLATISAGLGRLGRYGTTAWQDALRPLAVQAVFFPRMLLASLLPAGVSPGTVAVGAAVVVVVSALGLYRLAGPRAVRNYDASR